MQKSISIRTKRRGLVEITYQIAESLSSISKDAKLLNIFLQHTSASLTIQENADPSAKRDLETWINKIVPENEPWYTHTFEGSDDMPAHIKTVLTTNSLNIPLGNREMLLGTWQGIYLWEHRDRGSSRNVIITVL